MSTSPDAKKLAGLSAEEKRLLLARLLRERASGRGRVPEPNALGTIEIQAQRTPEAPAVTDDQGRALTYAHLVRAASDLAVQLAEKALPVESRIGIALGRSAELIPVVLGIWKAGYCYVPLDLQFPASRLRQIVEDSEVSLILADEASVASSELAGLGPVHVLPAGWTNPRSDCRVANPTRTIRSDQLAYVLYTSGSTGRPKGVSVSHGAVQSLFESLRRILPLGPQDVVLGLTTLSFDIALVELIYTLTTGGRVHLVDWDAATDGRTLARIVAEQAVSYFQATPATWRLLLDTDWSGRADLILASTGEAIPPNLARRLAPCGACLWNLYGPTETTVYASASRLSPGFDAVTIGKPLANTRMYVLDRHLQPVPLGVVGELYIGGDGLARGYLNRPGLTAERFLPDPFAEVSGARMYRTGDLARWLPDGNLECLGRVDHQVKIRGFRIELGEIESVLERHASVKQAVVVAREDATGDKRLVAYVTCSEPPPTATELHQWVATRLPDYMVPSALIRLESLPLTPSGKVDRQRLPIPEQVAMESSDGDEGPRTVLEETLAQWMIEILGRAKIGIHENFFILGGHSLKAAQLLARVREHLGVDLPLRVLFEVPTIAGLATRIEEARRARDPRGDAVPLGSPGMAHPSA